MSMGVVMESYQGILSHKAAKDRLKEAGSYLVVRESDIKRGKFVLSFVTKTEAKKHCVLRNPAFRKEFRSIEEGAEVMERMILSSDDCVHPVPPLPEAESDDNNNSLDDGPASDLACYACEFVAGHRRELNSHLWIHFVKECSHCQKFIPENAATMSSVRILRLLSMLSCQVSGYSAC